MKENELMIYAARDTSTGKLVSNITNPRRKYWDRRGNALSAINDHNSRVIRGRARANHGMLELVAFKLVEVRDVTDINVGNKRKDIMTNE